MTEHLERGDYAKYLYHAVVMEVALEALCGETALELVSEEEMGELVGMAADGLAGMVAIALRDLQTMKVEDNDE